jgi:hypothetical protein
MPDAHYRNPLLPIYRIAEKEFDRFITDDGKVQFDVSAHIIVSKKE